MAFVSTDLILGGPSDMTVTDSTPKFPVGTRIKGFDSTAQNTGEFIYLPGVASTPIGGAVVYDLFAKTTTLATTGSRGPVAISMAANTSSSTYGWYQVFGVAKVLETGATAGSKPYLGATAGTLTATVVATQGIDGMVYKTADGTPAAGFAYAELHFPTADNLG